MKCNLFVNANPYFFYCSGNAKLEDKFHTLKIKVFFLILVLVVVNIIPHDRIMDDSFVY